VRVNKNAKTSEYGRVITMNKIDRLSLTKDQVIDRLNNAVTFQQASIALFGQYVTMNSRERKCFRRKYGIDISSVIRQNA